MSIQIPNTQPASSALHSYPRTEQRHYGVESKENEDRYSSFFESIEQGYYEVDLSGNFLFFNDFLCRILKYDKDDLLRINYKKIIVKDDIRKILFLFKKIHNTGHPESGLIFEIIRKDGVKRKVGASVSILVDSEDNRIGFRGIIRDISERKLYEDRRQHAIKLESIGLLAAGIAHEINTPVQYVGDNMRFLLESYKEISTILTKHQELFRTVMTNSPTDKIMKEIKIGEEKIDLDYLNREIPRAISQSLEGLDRVAKIVLAVKNFSHPGTIEKIPTDINKAIQEAITLSRNEWKYIAEIKTEFDSSMPPVPLLQSDFNQVILNMIINSTHAIKEAMKNGTGEKGIIKICTLQSGKWAEIRISDTGMGIPKRIRSRVFDPFFTTKDVGEGTGQGLAISHSVIVNKHDGTINFDTEVGKGTTMIIRLPKGDGK